MNNAYHLRGPVTINQKNVEMEQKMTYAQIHTIYRYG